MSRANVVAVTAHAAASLQRLNHNTQCSDDVPLLDMAPFLERELLAHPSGLPRRDEGEHALLFFSRHPHEGECEITVRRGHEPVLDLDRGELLKEAEQPVLQRTTFDHRSVAQRKSASI